MIRSFFACFFLEGKGRGEVRSGWQAFGMCCCGRWIALRFQEGIKQTPGNQSIDVSEVGCLEDTSLLMTLTQGPGAGGHLGTAGSDQGREVSISSLPHRHRLKLSTGLEAVWRGPRRTFHVL